MVGTTPLKLQSYTTNQGATFAANQSYWGGAPNLDSTAFTLSASQPPQLLALQGGTVEVIVQFIPPGEQSILSNPGQYSIMRLKGPRPPRAVDALRSGAVHRPAGPAGDRLLARPPGDGAGAA
ncbi:MAG: ABC transporter substrate-binding protein [Solirubrobacteraceae bacterium]